MILIISCPCHIENACCHSLTAGNPKHKHQRAWDGQKHCRLKCHSFIWHVKAGPMPSSYTPMALVTLPGNTNSLPKKKQSWPKHNTDNDNAADNALILKTLPYHTMSVKKIPVQIQYIGWIKVYSDQSAQWQTWAFEDFETIVAKCPAPPFLKQGRLRFQRATSTKVFSLTPPFALVAGNSFSFAKANMYSIQNHWSISQGKIMQNKMNSNCYYINKKTSLK